MCLQGLQALIKTQHAFAFDRQACAAAATPAGAALDQGLAGQVVELVDGVPGGFVADACGLGGACDRALFGDVLEQGDALRAAGDVLGEQGG
ncbi:hypothetical protein D3C76_899610 [compost metagenome]